ncbi:serine hydrolase domain-containing protein [Brevundimonas sp.]|uniref:serine hydrolase domain-containing protein n=1 Tax=Brevundimonas sp. TaxID=1871086 RepID=UPI003BAB2E53
MQTTPMDLSRLTASRRSVLLGAGALSLAGAAFPAHARSAAPSTSVLPATQAVLDRYIAEQKLPGATVGVRLPDGSDVFLQAGKLDFGDAPAVTRDSLFRIYSMTKPITGAAAALLIEDGRLTLDTPVADFIPEFANLTVAVDPAISLDARPAATVMTVRHLLTHTSGLTYSISGDGPVQAEYRRLGVFPFTGDLGTAPGDGPKVRDLDAMAVALAQIPLLADPGTAYNYSVSLDVMGLVIQRASGMSFPDFVQRRLFDPVGMDHTLWRLGAGEARNLARIYDYSNGGRVPDAGASAEAYSAPVTLYAGGAGLISTTRDYLAFLTTILNDGRAGRVKVMKPETARLIHSDVMPPALSQDGNGYGFGGFVVRPGSSDAGQYGWDGAAGTKAWIDPARRYAAVMMVQFFPWGAIGIANEVRAAVAADIARLPATVPA